jgi:hypothetical protein
MSAQFAVVHSHADSVLPLRIFFSVCLVIVIFAGLYMFENRQKFFGRDPQVTGGSLRRAQFAAVASDPGLDSRD